MSIIARSTKMKVLWVRCECPNKTERTEYLIVWQSRKILCKNLHSRLKYQQKSYGGYFFVFTRYISTPCVCVCVDIGATLTSVSCRRTSSTCVHVSVDCDHTSSWHSAACSSQVSTQVSALPHCHHIPQTLEVSFSVCCFIYSSISSPMCCVCCAVSVWISC